MRVIGWRLEADYVPIVSGDVELLLRDRGGHLIAAATIHTDEFGAGTADLRVPATADAGRYDLTIAYAGARASTSLQIRAFEAPQTRFESAGHEATILCNRRSRKTMRSLPLSPALACVAVVACSSSYTPQARGRVAVTVRDGDWMYVRDGQQHEAGFFGSGLVDAVAGNRAAEAAARKYTSRRHRGFWTAVVGVVVGGIGGGLLSASENPGHRELAIPGASALLGGVVLAIVGGAYMGSAETYRWDAINLFNEASEASPTRLTLRRETSMHMRP